MQLVSYFSIITPLFKIAEFITKRSIYYLRFWKDTSKQKTSFSLLKQNTSFSFSDQYVRRLLPQIAVQFAVTYVSVAYTFIVIILAKKLTDNCKRIKVLVTVNLV